MRKVITSLVALGLATVLVADAQAGPFGWFRRGRPVYVQPAPARAPAMARAEEGYRAFAYEPARVEQGYRSFAYEPAAPAVRYQAPARRAGGGGHAYENAANKALGRVN